MDYGSRIDAIKAAIDSARQRCGRGDDVRLLAVSKTRASAEISAVQAAGIADFGENYVQEAVAKIGARDGTASWHFIGAIQSNKTGAIARHFQWVHTIDRLRIARRLDAAAARPLDVCIQVNVDAEAQKAGAAPHELAELVAGFADLSRLQLRGLMVIPQADGDARASFRRTRRLFEQLAPDAGPHWDTLSMGMSGDFEIAIEEGATMVRIGTAIFGPRLPEQAEQAG